jgi:hypothetical protein
MRRAVPFAITFVTALVLLGAVMIPPIEPIREEFALFFDILAAFAFLLGGASLLGQHGRKIRCRARGWVYSVVCLGAFILTLVSGLLKIGGDGGLAGSVTAEGSVLAWIYEYVFGPCDASLMSLLAFYVASASFRAFRVRNTEATVMLVTAFIVLIGRTFLGGVATDWLPPALDPLKIPNLVQWIMSVPITAGNRAIMIGIALGIVSTSLKVILGIDRTYLGEDS